jgi:hypothetical protein
LDFIFGYRYGTFHSTPSWSPVGGKHIIILALNMHITRCPFNIFSVDKQLPNYTPQDQAGHSRPSGQREVAPSPEFVPVDLEDVMLMPIHKIASDMPLALTGERSCSWDCAGCCRGRTSRLFMELPVIILSFWTEHFCLVSAWLLEIDETIDPWCYDAGECTYSCNNQIDQHSQTQNKVSICKHKRLPGTEGWKKVNLPLPKFNPGVVPHKWVFYEEKLTASLFNLSFKFTMFTVRILYFEFDCRNTFFDKSCKPDI